MKRSTTAALGLGLAAGIAAGMALQRRRGVLTTTLPTPHLAAPGGPTGSPTHNGLPNQAPNGRKQMSRFKISRRTTVACASLVLAISASLGWAAWTSSGVGPTGAKVTGAGSLTVVRATPVTGLLAPGITGAIAATVTNTGPYDVAVNHASIPSNLMTLLSGGPCPTTLLTRNASVMLATPVVVAAGATEDIEFPGSITLDASAPETCQGAEFTIGGVTVSGVQN